VTNLVEDNSRKEFYVWLDPENALVKHNIETTGILKSHPAAEDSTILIISLSDWNFCYIF